MICVGCQSTASQRLHWQCSKNGDKAKVRLRGEDIPLNPWDQLLRILGSVLWTYMSPQRQLQATTVRVEFILAAHLAKRAGILCSSKFKLSVDTRGCRGIAKIMTWSIRQAHKL